VRFEQTSTRVLYAILTCTERHSIEFGGNWSFPRFISPLFVSVNEFLADCKTYLPALSSIASANCIGYFLFVFHYAPHALHYPHPHPHPLSFDWSYSRDAGSWEAGESFNKLLISTEME